jgi:DNA-binding transcriptional ArsR family regulator
VLRIHFTSEDVGRVRVAARPDPLWETVFSLFRLRFDAPPLVFGRWRRHALRSCRRADLGMLLPLIPGGYYPDFLTPVEGALGLEAGLEAILATPRSRLRHDMELLPRRAGQVPSWMHLLHHGDRPTLQRLATAIRGQYEFAVAPFWAEVRAHVEADRSKRARAFLDGGCEGLLRSYAPMMQWKPPVLEIVDVPYEQDLYLDGRGLLLLPSFLSWSTLDVLRDVSLPPVLVYPIERSLTLPARADQSTTSTAALIGFTRASVLESIGDGRTTSELARRVGTSAASVSQHTAVLREAGLIQTSRVGKAVLHTITPLGTALLNGDALTTA